MIRGMPLRRYRLDRPAVARNPLAVGEDAVGRIIGVERRIGARAVVVECQRRAADNQGAGRFPERRGGGRMVAVGVRAKDRRDALTLHRAQDRVNMPSAIDIGGVANAEPRRSEAHTSELQSLMRISYAVFCLKKKKSIKLRSAIKFTQASRIKHL